MEFLKVVGDRRSIRWYKTWEPVPRDKIQRILEVARRCTSPGNTQPWRAVVVERDRLSNDVREELLAADNWQGAHTQAPVWIYWFADATATTGEGFARNAIPLIQLGAAPRQRWAPKLGYGGNHLIGDPGYGPIFSDYIKGRLHSITSWLITEDTPELQLYRSETRRYYGDEMLGFKWRYGMGHHISQSGWVGTRLLAKAAATLGADLTRQGFKKVLETNEFDSGMGVILKWPEGDHAKAPYAFNREYLYKWIAHRDGGWDLQRLTPDPIANS